jgi:hypothetical protein
VSERAAAAVAALRGKAAELERLVTTVTDADWERVCPEEGWPVALVAFHIARGFQRQAEWIEEARAGHAPHEFDWGVTHALNATIAAAHPAPRRDEALALARSSVDRITAALGAMDDSALERIAWRYDGRERDAVWIAGRLATDHARGHLESIATAIAQR